MPSALAKPPLGRPPNPGHFAAKGLVVAWLLREGSGDYRNAVDGIATTASTATWAPGRSGPARTYNGFQSDAVADRASLDFAGDVTILARLKTSAGTNQVVYGGYLNNPPYTGWGFGLGQSGGGTSKISYWSSATGAWVVGSTNVADGLWHDVGVSVSGTTATFYLDGRPDGTASTNGVVSSAIVKYVGNSTIGTDAFSGAIEFVNVWARALAAPEIAALYAAPYGMYAAPSAARFYVPAGGANFDVDFTLTQTVAASYSATAAAVGSTSFSSTLAASDSSTSAAIAAAALSQALAAVAASTGQATASVAVTVTPGFAAAGTGQSIGAAAFAQTLDLSSTGAVTFFADFALAVTQTLAASGVGAASATIALAGLPGVVVAATASAVAALSLAESLAISSLAAAAASAGLSFAVVAAFTASGVAGTPATDRKFLVLQIGSQFLGLTIG